MNLLTRRRLLTATGALGLAVTAGCAAQAPASNQSITTTGGLVARASTVDLGRVPFDQMAEARFELQNTSIRPVKLLAAPQVKMLEGC
jgi:hypothetical protein